MSNNNVPKRNKKNVIEKFTCQHFGTAQGRGHEWFARFLPFDTDGPEY